jgi:hypothetical protein
MSNDTETPTLADFLLARIAEDEEAARAATSGPWRYDPERFHKPPRAAEWSEGVFAGSRGASAICVATTGEVDDPQSMRDGAHIARHDPARVLAECAIKRRIVVAHNVVHDGCPGSPTLVSDDGEQDGDYGGPCLVLRALASVFAGHPEFREEWRA